MTTHQRSGATNSAPLGQLDRSVGPHRRSPFRSRGVASVGSVTNTAAGSILCSEFLTVNDGLFTSSTLIFDWRRWPAVLDAIRTRMTSGRSAALSK